MRQTDGGRDWRLKRLHLVSLSAFNFVTIICTCAYFDVSVANGI